MVPLAMFGWPLVAVFLFSCMQPRRAVIASYLGAWLFLPMASYDIPGIPNYTKVAAAAVGLVLGVLLFDARRLLTFRPQWIDGPMILFCLWTATSSISTGLGVWDAISSVVDQVIVWGVPYFAGRIYFKDLDSITELAIGIVIGGLIYVPLCLLEIRLSPQLHVWVYGYHQHSFAQSVRFGGFRPTVFMQHGLAVGMWMVSTTLLAIWLRVTGIFRQYPNLPVDSLAALLVMTCILCKSTGALSLMLIGAAVGLTSRGLKQPWPLLLLLAIPPLWMTGRIIGFVDGEWVYKFFSQVSLERAESFQTRLNQEDVFIRTAMERPIFGFGRWLDGADQLWLLYLRNFGIVGLAAHTTVFLLPGYLALRRIPFQQLCQPDWSAIVGLILIVSLSVIDNLVNAMMNPFFTIASGTLATVCCRDFCQENSGNRCAVIIASHYLTPKRQFWPPTATPVD